MRLQGRSGWSAAVVAYSVYAILVLAPVWSGSVEPKWDARGFNYPAFAYAIETVRSGSLPLWSPYTNCGEPFIADPAYLWYQPGALVAGLLTKSAFDGYMLFWTAVWAWAGLGAFVLAAALGASAIGSFVAAVAFSMSGFFVGHGQHLPYAVTAAWIPWVLGLGHLAVARKSWAFTLLCGTALGLSALGGYAGLVVFELLALGLWLTLAFAFPWSGPAMSVGSPFRERAGWVAKVLVTGTVLLVVIWSPSLYAFLVEARDFTDRTKPVTDDLALRGNPFPVRALISFLFPRTVIDQAPSFPSDVSMTNAYLGTLALPFAFVWLKANGRRAWWLAFVVVFWVLASFGAEGGVRIVLHHLVPPTAYMRHNGMLRVLFLAPLAAAAGLGVTHFARSTTSSRTLFAAWGLVTLACAAAIAFLFEPDAATLRQTAPALLISVFAAAVVALPGLRERTTALGLLFAAVFALDLAWHVHGNSFTLWDAPEGVQRLREIEQYPRPDPLVPRSTDPFFRTSKLNLVNRLPVVEGYVALVSTDFSALQSGPFLDALALHRYWISPSAWPAPPRADGVAALSALGPSDPVPVLVQAREDALPREPVVPGHFGSVGVVTYAPDRVELAVDVPGQQDAMLASTERYAPSWRVRVDGVEKRAATVNYFFRGVRLPPGSHRVIFEYVPTVFVVLLVTSYVVMLAALAVAFWLWRSASPRPVVPLVPSP
jgi:hypothetical protein